MKKITRPFLGIMTVFLLVLTAACSGSDDSDSTNNNGGGGGGNADVIVGKWKYVGWYETGGEFIDDADETGCYDEFITFKSNKTGTYLEEDCEEGDMTSSFNWNKLGDNHYEMSGTDGSWEFTTSFDGNDRVTIVDVDFGGGEVYERQ